MADTRTRKRLTRFQITAADQGYRLRIEDDAGETIEFDASAEQLELLADTLDDLLSADDALDAAEDD